MKMKITTYLFLSCIILSGCNALNNDRFEEPHRNLLESAQTYKNFRGYEPVDPVEFEDKILISRGDSLIVSKDIKLLNREETLGFLNNETVLVAVGEINREGDINYLPITFSKKNTSYRITMDYMKYATLAQISENQFIGSKRVGVGLRLISLITTAEAGINISDLYSIGLAAKEGKLSGTLIIEVIGIKSKEVTSLIPLPSEINQTTIQNAMQALATIKSKIYDEETSLYPQVMAIKKYKKQEQEITVITDGNNQRPSENTNRPEEVIVSAGKTVNIDEDSAEDNTGLDDTGILLQFGNIKFSSEEKKAEASQYLTSALKSILDKDIDQSISKLEKYEQAFPLYSVNLILGELKKNRKVLSNKDAPEWQKINNLILDNYDERLPASIIEELENP